MARLEFTPTQIDERIKADPEMIGLAKDDPDEFEAQHAQLYRSFGYRPDGSPLGKVQKVFGETSRATGIPEGVIKGVASAVLPTALTIGGAVGGAAVSGGIGAPFGAAGGAVAGEFANYGLGITEEPPTPFDIGVAAGTSLLGPLGSRAKAGLGPLLKRMPGAGMEMHPLAAGVFKKHIQHMRIDAEDVTTLRGLIDQVPDFHVKIPITRDILGKELEAVSRSLKPDTAYIKELEKIQDRFADQPFLSFKELMATEKDLILSGSESAHAVWSKLSGTLIDDLDKQALNPKLSKATRNKIAEGVQSFKMYSAFNKRFRANTELDNIVKRVVTEIDGDELVRFNSKTFVKELEHNKVLKSTFEPTEIADMKAAIKDLGYLAAPPGSGVNQVGRSIHAGAGGALGLIGYSLGGYQGMLIAGLGVAELIRVAISSQTGRNVVRYMATQGKGRVNAIELDRVLGQVIAGSLAGAGAGLRGSEPESIHPFPNQE